MLLLVLIAIGIHVLNRYELVENISTVLVVLVTGFAVVVVFLVQFTQYQWSIADISHGLRFQIAAGSMGVALSMFGMTGVGAGEITAYTYWCVEKGYAAWTGPNDGSEDWVRRARGWVRVMKWTPGCPGASTPSRPQRSTCSARRCCTRRGSRPRAPT